MPVSFPRLVTSDGTIMRYDPGDITYHAYLGSMPGGPLRDDRYLGIAISPWHRSGPSSPPARFLYLDIESVRVWLGGYHRESNSLSPDYMYYCPYVAQPGGYESVGRCSLEAEAANAVCSAWVRLHGLVPRTRQERQDFASRLRQPS